MTYLASVTVSVSERIRTYKMLREQMTKLLNQFENSEITKENLDETAVIIQQINTTLYGFKNND